MPQMKLENNERWPYSPGEYLGRFLWRFVSLTIWRLCWHRIRFLRPALLRMFGGRCALNADLFADTRIEIPWNLELNERVTISSGVTVYNLGKVSIGSQSTISQNAYLCGGTHDYTDPTMPLVRKPIVIGHSVWIGEGAFIGPGTVIGDGAVVGARAVVVKNVDPWTVVAGNPARFIKKRELLG